jgi:hypothetical protein
MEGCLFTRDLDIWMKEGFGKEVSYKIKLGYYLDPDYVRSPSLRAIWNFCEGRRLP